MYSYEELLVEPLLNAEPVRMPINVLLALPEYVTSNATLHPFNVPGVINYLMEDAGWERAAKVMRPYVWAPGWNTVQLRAFVTAPFGEKQRIFPSAGLRGLRVRHFSHRPPSVNKNDWQTPRYDIVHVLANFPVSPSSFNDPYLLLTDRTPKDDDFIKGRALTAGALRDELAAAKTRLLILQVGSYEESNAQRLARFVVGSGGPAVLVIVCLNAQTLDEYFLSLYANIVHNRDLNEVALPPSASVFDAALSVRLFYGQGGRQLLRFDRWLSELNEQIGRFESLAHQAKDVVEQTLADVRPYLHSVQARRIAARPFTVEGAPIDFSHEAVLTELNDLRSNIDFAHEAGGAIPLTQIAEKMLQVHAMLGTLENNYPKLHEMLAAHAKEEAAHAPRVLNAGFADPQTQQPLPPKQALVIAQEYDLMVDVGPRWKEFESWVTDNSEFPEGALPSDVDGYLIKIVLLSEDFQAVKGAPISAQAGGTEEAIPTAESTGEPFEVVDIKPNTDSESALTPFTDEFRPCALSQLIWLPRNTGASFPVINGERAEHPGPVLLRVRAPDFPTASGEPFTMARARLCLYYQNNLLQSARIRVGIARTRDHVTLDVANEITVDYVLTGSYQNIEQYAARKLLTGTGEATDCAVGMNVTLNDDGVGGHRIVVEHDKELTFWRPYDPDAAKGTLDRTRTKLKDCFWKKNAVTCDLVGTEAKREDGLQADNGKTLRQFQCDLFWLAQHGAVLYEDMLGQLNRPDLIPWTARLSQALATKTVIQVARTSLAQYVFPWALIYDIPLPDRTIQGALRWCEVLKTEWSDPEGRRTLQPADVCPFHDRPEHEKNTLCPYGFWGLKHYIEQPINLQPKSGDTNTNGNPKLPPDAYTKITPEATLDVAVGMTRDKELDPALLNTHLTNIKGIAAYMPASGADDWNKVQAMLQAPELVYFLCHGEYDVNRDEPYLGVGLHDDNFVHRVYPKQLTAWAITQGATFWQNRHPLIFINGCHTSNLRPGEILNFVTTFANFGASGVIGTEVSIRLPLATDIAEKLLRKIVAGASVGEAMRQIRWEFVNKGNLLGLAYTPYCMSSLHVERTGQ